jgi:hypothetical protein
MAKPIDEKILWPIFSKFIRLRDTNDEGIGKCFTCNRYIMWNKGQCGHGIPRQHKATKYSEKNNHLQCAPCNGFEGGRREVYKIEMDKRYGPNTWDLMEHASRQPFSFSPFEIKALYDHYKREVEKLLKSKNF